MDLKEKIQSVLQKYEDWTDEEHITRCIHNADFHIISDELVGLYLDQISNEDGLCDLCPLDKKKVYGVDGGYVAGREGSRCDEAKEAFLES